MTSSLVQPYIDQENSNAVQLNNNRGRLGSLAGRQGKTFGSSSTPLATPRRALGNLSNDPTKKALASSIVGKKSLNTGGDGNIIFKKSLPSQLGPVFKKPSITTPGFQNLTSKKRALKLESDGAAKKVSAPKLSEAMPSVFEDSYLFPDVENMHVYDELKHSAASHIPDSDCLSRLLNTVGTMRAPLIHHAKKDDFEPDFSHMQLETNSRSNEQDDFTSSSLLDLPSGASAMSLHSCLLDLPPLESVDFLDLNSIPDFCD